MDFQSIALPTELRYRPFKITLHLPVLSGCAVSLIAGANIELFLDYAKQKLKKINSYLCSINNEEMLLAVDIGNTKIKAAVFEDAALLQKFSFSKGEAEEIFLNVFKNYPEITSAILSTVGKEEDALLLWLRERVKVVEVNRQMAFPFENKYATPQTLGIDRMVLAAGAVLQYPAQNRLVIDAGTCVTYDFISAEGAYLGGAISPGLQLRYNAMHTFTEKLPLLYPEIPQSHSGNTTATGMHAGAVFGLVFEIEGFISAYLQGYGQLTVILTGGDADFLAKSLKNTIFANSNFLLESLNSLYKYTNHK